MRAPFEGRDMGCKPSPSSAVTPMRAPLAFVFVMLLASCAPDPADFDFPPKGCVQAHASACEELYGACLGSALCRKPPFDFEMPQTCRPTCQTLKRDCHRRCPIWPPPKVPEAFKPYP